MIVVFELVLGLVIADVLIAFFHWIEDAYFSFCMTIPVLSTIAKDNSLHHYFPRDIVAYSYLENMTVTFPMAVLLLLVAFASMPAVVMKYKYMFGTIFVVASIANIFHRFAHMRDCELPMFINMLQGAGVLVGHDHHKLHHETSNSKYGVIMPITNYVLDGIGLWRCLELSISFVSGIRSEHTMTYEDYVNRLQRTRLHDETLLKCPPRPHKAELEPLKSRLDEHYACQPGFSYIHQGERIWSGSRNQCTRDAFFQDFRSVSKIVEKHGGGGGGGAGRVYDLE